MKKQLSNGGYAYGMEFFIVFGVVEVMIDLDETRFGGIVSDRD